MNPACYPTEHVPMQGRNDGYPVQPGGPTVTQYTTVNVISEAPQDHVVWSICSFIHLNPCCLGLAALIYSFKARDRKIAGDMAGARHYGSTARCLNIWAIVLLVASVLIVIIVVAVQVSAVVNAISYNRNYG